MYTQKDIDNFYKHLEGLKLVHPGAELEAATGFSKGIISEILNKKRKPSKGFLKIYYEKFSKGSQGIRQGGNELTDRQLSGVIEANLVLARTNEEHTRMLNAKLQVANKDLTAIVASLRMIDGRLRNLEEAYLKKKYQKNESEAHVELDELVDDASKAIADAARKSRGSGKQKPDSHGKK